MFLVLKTRGFCLLIKRIWPSFDDVDMVFAKIAFSFATSIHAPGCRVRVGRRLDIFCEKSEDVLSVYEPETYKTTSV